MKQPYIDKARARHAEVTASLAAQTPLTSKPRRLMVFEPPKQRKAPTDPLPPPLRIDEAGLAWCVLMAPTTEDAWTALTGRTSQEDATLAVRMCAVLDRLQLLSTRIAKGVALIHDYSHIGPVPDEWVQLLSDLCVEELEATWTFDGIAHEMAAAHLGAWIETAPPPSDDPVGDLISRILTRTTQAYGAMNPEPTTEITAELARIDQLAREQDVEGIRDCCRRILKAAVAVRHGGAGRTGAPS
jgi:hypothetical protein